MPKSDDGDDAPLPSTLERSPKKAQDTYEKTLESAEQTYDGDQARAHRTAWAAVKHSFEKVGDHWEAKDERGPSDERAASGGEHPRGTSHGGVDVTGRTKDELIELARERDVRVTSHMTKDDIADALESDNDRATRNARER
jgi:cation transport regulator ChaB